MERYNGYQDASARLRVRREQLEKLRKSLKPTTSALSPSWDKSRELHTAIMHLYDRASFCFDTKYPAKH